MKRICVGLLILLSNQLVAQITFGPKLGVGFSKEKFSVVENKSRYDVEGPHTNYIVVPTISAVVDIPLSKTFSIRPEIGYRGQAYSYITQYYYNYLFISASGTQTNIIQSKLDYIEVPVNLSMKLPMLERRIELLVGATFGLCIGGKGTVEQINTEYFDYYHFLGPNPYFPKNKSKDVKVHPGNIPTPAYEYDVYIDEVYVNRYNFNLNFGAVYKLTKAVVFNAVCNYGLSNMAAHYDTKSQREGSITSLSYSLTMAYMFGGNKKIE